MRWDWMFFYVEQVREGLIRLDYDYFFAYDIIWDGSGPGAHTAVIPMENTALLAISVLPTQAFATLHSSRETGMTPLTRGAGGLIRGPLSPQGLTTTDDIKALLRQLGPQAVLL